jgi:asparagine synthase (glutamine-hydrolysing)
MCGICGIIGRESGKNEQYVRNMSRSFLHRGPDSEGFYMGEKICMGVRRLSIIDLYTGEQPIYNEDRNIALVFNGEIYNHLELREELESRGHKFKTNTDAEVIVHLYEEDGKACLGSMKGMFSFALWDAGTRTLFAARDRFGIKPFYYYAENGRFVFSSELRSILDLPFVERTIDREALNLYLSLEYVPAPYSIIKGIKKLRPAHYVFVKEGRIETGCYWDLKRKGCVSSLKEGEIEERTLHLLKTSVRQHLASDVPVGVFLSGGIDSSVLARLVSLEKGDGIPTFTISFDEKTFDESRYARKAAEYTGAEHHEHTFTFSEFLETYKASGRLLDEPFADISIFPSYMLARTSSEYIKAALSGEGGDEAFMGYPTYLAHRYAEYFRYVPGVLRRLLVRAASAMPSSYDYLSFDFKVKKFCEAAAEPDPVKRHLEWMGAFLPSDKRMILKENAAEPDDALQRFTDRMLRIPGEWNVYKKVQYLDINTYLAEDLLVKADRASMAASLELRVPYLDHELVEFLWSVKPGTLYQKRLLKKIFRGKLPPEILARQKKGFAVPFSVWLRRPEFIKLIRPYFDEGFIKRQGIFEAGPIGKIFKDHIKGRVNNRKRLRTYIMFQKWYESLF